MPGEYFVADSDVPLLQTYLTNPSVQAALPPGKVIRFGSDSANLANKLYRTMYVLDAKPICRPSRSTA